MAHRLVNPYTTSNKFISNNTDLMEAATDIWGSLSKNTKKYIPESYFTIQNNNTNNIHHFKVNEKLIGGTVYYEINEHTDHNNDNQFLKTLNSLSTSIDGGKKKHKSHNSSKNSKSSKTYKKYSSKYSSSSDSSSDSSSLSSSSSSSDESSKNLDYFIFKPKEKVYYSSLLEKPKTYYLDYYNIYNTKLTIPYYFSKYTVTVNPLLIL